MDLLLTFGSDTTSPAGQRRLRRVVRLCEGPRPTGPEIRLRGRRRREDNLKLLYELDQIIDSDTDNIRLHQLPADGFNYVRTFGIAHLVLCRSMMFAARPTGECEFLPHAPFGTGSTHTTRRSHRSRM